MARRCVLAAASAVLLLGASAQAAGARTIRLFSSPTSNSNVSDLVIRF